MNKVTKEYSLDEIDIIIDEFKTANNSNNGKLKKECKYNSPLVSKFIHDNNLTKEECEIVFKFNQTIRNIEEAANIKIKSFVNNEEGSNELACAIVSAAIDDLFTCSRKITKEEKKSAKEFLKKSKMIEYIKLDREYLLKNIKEVKHD